MGIFHGKPIPPPISVQKFTALRRPRHTLFLFHTRRPKEEVVHPAAAAGGGGFHGHGGTLKMDGLEWKIHLQMDDWEVP